MNQNGSRGIFTVQCIKVLCTFAKQQFWQQFYAFLSFDCICC